MQARVRDTALLGAMAQQLGRFWGLLGEDVKSGAAVSCYPNLLGPTLEEGRMLAPDWLPTGLVCGKR